MKKLEQSNETAGKLGYPKKDLTVKDAVKSSLDPKKISISAGNGIVTGVGKKVLESENVI